MESDRLTFLSALCLSLFLGIFSFLVRRRKSALHDLRGPESRSFWLGPASIISTVLVHFTNDLQVISLNTCTKKRQANQSLNGCVNMAPLGAFGVAWELGLPPPSAVFHRH